VKLLNHTFSNNDALEQFIEDHRLREFPSVLIQMYLSHIEAKQAYEVRDLLTAILPNAVVMATSTAGIISDVGIRDESLLLSFSIFEESEVKSSCFWDKSPESVVETISQNMITSRTKLLIVFADTFRFDASALMTLLGRRHPDVVIAGGNAGDDFRFEGCELFSESCDRCDVIFACVDSDILEISTHYLLNWQTIGQTMEVTRSNGSEVIEINGKRALDTYRHYLGDEVADHILEYGIEFPLIYRSDAIDVARAPVAFDLDKGSITFAGNVPEGAEVQFGYANIEHIEHANRERLEREILHKNEAVYVYSCGSRRQMLGEFLNRELEYLSQIGPISGFITYGEFFHDQAGCHNNLLNLTTTFVTLNESICSAPISLVSNRDSKNKNEVILKALTTLVRKTSEDLEENIHYLNQFKKVVSESSIFSITDDRGIIVDVNDNFLEISGYCRDELIGKSHNIVRSEEMSKKTFREMWKSLKEGKLWKGLVKNRRKDGSLYYVLTQIMPIFDHEGNFREYVAIRNDVTELEEYREFLKNELDITSRNYEESLYYAQQYETAINSMTAVLKTDTQNMITYANETFCMISGYSMSELIGKNCEELRHPKHVEEGKCKEIRSKLAEKHLVHETLTNINKNGDETIFYSLFYPILDKKGDVAEHMHVMHDITEIVKLSEEIVDTQKEVVATMGAIGETRSKETGLHVKRVAEYSYLLAKLYGLSEEEAMLLKQASPMHDIGKVAIADAILNKPGKLTFEEFEIMKTHAELGYEMLRHSDRPILKASATVALSHHEKYDGSGYPYGQKGEAIPVFGRITALADVFDALGHERVYKKAWEDEKIFELFRNERGKHFDPVLIDLFFEHLDQFLLIRTTHLDRLN